MTKELSSNFGQVTEGRNAAKANKRTYLPYLAPSLTWYGILIGMSVAYLVWMFVIVPGLRLYSLETFWISMPILSFAFILCVWGAIQSGFSLRDLGIRFNNYQRDIRLAIFSSIIILIPAIIIKSYWIKGSGDPLFNLSNYLNPWVIPAYLLVVPVQNFIFRSCIQGILYNVRLFNKSRILVIVVTSILYSAFHWHISPILALLTFFPGLLWGIIYDYTHSLLAPVFSHAITGLIFFYIIGIPKYLLPPVA